MSGHHVFPFFKLSRDFYIISASALLCLCKEYIIIIQWDFFIFSTKRLRNLRLDYVTYTINIPTRSTRPCLSPLAPAAERHAH